MQRAAYYTVGTTRHLEHFSTISLMALTNSELLPAEQRDHALMCAVAQLTAFCLPSSGGYLRCSIKSELGSNPLSSPRWIRLCHYACDINSYISRSWL